MGQPTPPGDMPLIEGLGSEWNEFVSAIPEDQRAALAPKLKERVTDYETRIESYKPWEELQKSGITPEHANTAVGLFATIENNPREVYETLGKHLGISTEQAQQVVEELDEADGTDPEIQRLKQQVDTLSQITLASKQQERQAQLAAENDAKLDAEIAGVKKKYGEHVPEDELLMRMLHKGMTAEQAYQEYSSRVNDIRSTRPSPMLLGGGSGAIPQKTIDPTKLNNKDTKSIVAQMLDHSNSEARK